MADRENVETLERGNVYFFYRPRVEEEDPEALEDVQNTSMVLSVHGDDRYRLGIIGRKHFPDPGAKQERIWGFIEAVEKDPKRIVEALQGEEYETKTRGARHQPAARPAGEGVYRIVRHEDHTHLVYALELPQRPGEVQEGIELEEEASYVITVKNPEKPSPGSAGLPEDRTADYPASLQGEFRDRRFIDADPPRLLDYEGSEFVLISAAEDVKDDLGIELNPQDEDESRAEIFSDLRLEKSQQPIEPLTEGDWE
jgi:hypothetical protein